MAAQVETAATFELRHPTAGVSRFDLAILAVRWRPQATRADKEKMLADQGLVLMRAGSIDAAPLARVNQTEGLSWVGAKDGSVADDVIKRLEDSDLVQWVMPALRPIGTEAAAARGAHEPPPPMEALYTVNPTRVYVRATTLDAAGGVTILGAGMRSGPSRLRGYVTVEIDDASFSASRTAAHAAAGMARAMGVTAAAVDVRYETIPLLSPTTHSTHAPALGGSKPQISCKPPLGDFTPDDPMFTTQWGLLRVGAPRGWQITRGNPSITVAVIDEGVELGHPDLQLHPLSWNASDDTPDGGPTGNHGTACAGIIGARLNNTQGVAGLAGGVRVMAIATATWADVDIAEGLYFAADNGARAVSMSFGVYASWHFWDFDLIRDALQYCADQDIVLIAASGNEDGAEARFPGSDGRTLCVGGSNRSDERKRIGDSSSENWWGASYGPDVDVVAPCLEMPTTDRLGLDGYNNASDYYDRFNGTSSATPLVAGLAGLLLSMRPNLSGVEVRSIIERTCDKISPALYAYANVPTKPSGTWNSEVGYGRINVERALLVACEQEDCRCDETCSGCGGECVEPPTQECRGPAPVPWLPYDRCMIFYESRVFDIGDRGPVGNNQAAFQRLRLRVTYEHCLQLVGRQQGALLYTTTLLPGEEVKVYEYDRYRRTKGETQVVSVQTSFRQTVSALSQTRRSNSSTTYVDTLNEIRTHADTSVSAGGGLAGFFGAPTVKGEGGVDTETSVASGGSVRTASEQFTQFAITASQAMEAERSTVISTFEDLEHVSTTGRTLKNHNHCYAVTYYARRVNEVYSVHSRIVAIEWRVGDTMAWHSVDDLAELPDSLRDAIIQMLKQLLRNGREARDTRQITVPIDGVLYEAELAHCSSCEPVRMAEDQMRLERLRLSLRRACLKNEMLQIELERRRMGQGVVAEVAPVSKNE